MGGTRTRTEQFREATKRQIVGVLTDTTNNGNGSPTDLFGAGKSPARVDGADETHVSMMIEDLQRGLNRQLESIKLDMSACKQEQYQAHCRGMMKIPKSTRDMSIRDFNQKYKCDLLDLLKNVRANAFDENNSSSEDTTFKSAPVAMCGKRDRLETPIPFRGNRPLQTPATVVRTVRRGEMLYSRNGSPVDPIDEGALVATVSKKRRGNAPTDTAANFDINIGEGRYISLNNPNGVENLDDSMKTNALSQLKVLQDQMATLMEQLTTKDTK